MKEGNMEEKTISVDSTASTKSDRRGFIKGAAIALGAAAAGAITPSSAQAVTAEPPAPRATGDSLLQKIISTKKIRFGVDLGFPPLQFKKANGDPTGYIIELSEMLAASLGATPEWVEVPFANLFAQQAPGQRIHAAAAILDHVRLAIDGYGLGHLCTCVCQHERRSR
jgi:hypothetical protein